MIKNLNKMQRKDDTKLLCIIIVAFLFVVWLFTPPGNKFAQVCLWGNQTQYLIAKMQNKDETTAYKFLRNNAVYHVQMKQKKEALENIDNAINSLPVYFSDSVLDSLYRDRGIIKLYYRDYKGALADFTRIKNYEFNDYFKLAMLYKVNGNNKLAIKACNEIIAKDATAYAGYLCYADIYAGIGRPDASVNVFNLLIDKAPNRAKYYADRAQYKLLTGDQDGYSVDMAKAKELAPSMNFDSSLVKDTLEPKTLVLGIL